MGKSVNELCFNIKGQTAIVRRAHEMTTGVFKDKQVLQHILSKTLGKN